jgi:hypothetical protein
MKDLQHKSLLANILRQHAVKVKHLIKLRINILGDHFRFINLFLMGKEGQPDEGAARKRAVALDDYREVVCLLDVYSEDASLNVVIEGKL